MHWKIYPQYSLQRLPSFRLLLEIKGNKINMLHVLVSPDRRKRHFKAFYSRMPQKRGLRATTYHKSSTIETTFLQFLWSTLQFALYSQVVGGL